MSLDRSMRIVFCLAVVHVVSAVLAVPVAVAEEPAGEAAPAPCLEVDLEGLEPAVAEQLGDLREYLVANLEAAEPAERAELLGEMGRHLHAYGLADPAVACYRAAAALRTADLRWAYLQARVLQGAGRLDQAAALLERSLALAPGYLPAMVALGEIRLEQNRLEEAEVILRRALEVSSLSPSALAVLGQVQLARGEFAAAAESLRLALEQVPEATRLHHPLGLAYRGLGEMEKAQEHLAQRGPAGVRPPDPLLDPLEELKRGEAVHMLRGRRAYRAGQLEAAAEAFRAAVASEPDSVAARVNLGTVLSRLGDAAGAVLQFRAALELEPDNPTARFNLGSLLASQGHFESAIAELAEATRLEPGDAGIRVALAGVRGRAGDWQGALADYRQARDLDPRSEAALLGEAESLLRLGRGGEAKAVLEWGHEQAPTRGGIVYSLARLLAAAPDPALRDGERAVELARRVWEAAPSPGHADTLALALGEAGRCAEAAEVLEEAAGLAEEAGAGELAAALRQGVERYSGKESCRPPVATE